MEGRLLMAKPQDTDNTIYIESYMIDSIQDILDACKEKWGDIEPSNLMIEHDNIQFKCFGYDQYDPDDYIDYFVVTRQLP